jgi:DNA-binding transcriptional LysR family regulator
VETTEAGRVLYDYCRQMDSIWQEARAVVGEIRSRPKGTLRLNAPVTMGQFVLPPIIGGFLAEYPDVQVVLDLRDSYVDIIEGGYDVAIRVGKMKDSSMRAKCLGTVRMHLYAHRDYLARHGIPSTPSDLASHNCLVYRFKSGDPYQWEFAGPQGDATVQVHGNFSADNGAPLYQAALAGLGIARLPAFYELAFGLGDMVYVLEDYAIDSPVHAVYASTRHTPPAIRCFIDYLSAHFHSM